jgi:gliding motility-associated-like protein
VYCIIFTPMTLRHLHPLCSLYLQKVLVILCILVFCGVAHAQENWLRKAGGSNLDEAMDVAVSPIGNHYLAGYFSGAASFQINSYSSLGMSDAVIVAYDDYGNPQWSNRFGGAGSDRALSVACTNEEIVVTGFFYETVNFGNIQLTAADSGDVFVVKMNAFGDVMWAKSAGGLYSDAGYGVTMAPNGDVFITGEFKGEAQFGGVTVISMNGEGGTIPSPDVFTAKLNSSGDWQWVKTGSGAFDDRGMDIDLDASGNVYVTGQFTNDITFDLTHANTIENAGFVIKYSPAGAEQWFVKMGATQVLPYALRVDGTAVYVAGESIGQMIYFGSNSIVVPAVSSFSGFLGKLTTNGSVTWGTEDGSGSYVSFRAMDVADEEVYLGGTFQCIMDEYALELGPGLFNSAGFKDSFGAAYNASGERLWMRQYASPGEDVCHGIAANNLDDVVMAGSFDKIFNVPDLNGLFVNNATLFVPNDGSEYQYPNNGSALCGYASYGDFIHVKSAGNRDMYIGRLYNATAPHYDFYSREGCALDIENSCISTANTPLDCSAFATGCDEVRVFGLTNTGSSCFIGPEYNTTWQNGSHALFQDVNETGWVTWTTEREDGCSSHLDSLFVTVLPLPVPLITDDEGINLLQQPNANDIQLCAPDQVVLTGSSEDGQTGWWSTPNGPVNVSSITVSESGSYAYVIDGENGCTGENAIGVEFIVPLDEIDPLLQFEDPEFASGDTLRICGNELVHVEIIDLLEQLEFPIYTSALWSVVLDGDTVTIEEDAAIEYDFYADSSGFYEVIAAPYFHIEEPCPNDTIWYPLQSLFMHIEVLDTPYLDLSIQGASVICEGETLIFTAQSNAPFVWSGPGVVGLTTDSIVVTGPGTYGVSSSIEYKNGCTAEGTESITVSYPAAPQLSTNPSHNVLCPNESITLISPLADSYQWIGPLGQVLGTSQTLSVNTPGSYYCILTTGSCVLESSILDIQAYSTPYIVALPSYDLCLEGYVTIAAQVNPEAEVQWLPPLSGNELTKNVFLPNEYSVSVTFCGITNVISVTITQTTPEPVIGASANGACPGEVIALYGPGGMGEYAWSPGNGTSDTLFVTEGATYVLTVTDTNGCVGSSMPYTVSYYNISPPQPNDFWLCEGDSVVAFAFGNDVFWSSDPFGDEVIAVGNSYASPPLFATVSVYVYQEDDNCRSAIEPVLLFVNPVSVAYIATTEAEWCEGSTVTLEANTPGLLDAQYIWQTPMGQIDNQGVLTLDNSTADQTGWYMLTVAGQGCINPLDSLWVLIESPYSQDLVVNQSIGVCRNQPLNVFAEVVLNNMFWDTPTGIVNDDFISISEANESHTGMYVVHGDGIACDAVYDSVEVSVREYPIIDLVEEDVYCDRGYMTAHVPEGYDFYLWNTGDTNADAVVPLDGYVFVSVTNWPSCAVTDSLYVEEIDCISDFPNVFTPNGDGQNDFLDFGWLRIPIDEVHIYNRWGNLVRHLTTEPFVWDGRNDVRELVSDAAYYYVIRSPDPSGQFHNVEGYIHALGSGQGVNGQ